MLLNATIGISHPDESPFKPFTQGNQQEVSVSAYKGLTDNISPQQGCATRHSPVKE